jgi:hypothetical protein
MEFLGYISEMEFHKVIKRQILFSWVFLFISGVQPKIVRDYLKHKLVQT